MEAKELRIGNFVEYDKRAIKVELSDLSLIGNPFNKDRFYPRPLTEEWLLKFGFEKKSWKTKEIIIECFYYEKNGIVIYLVSDFFEIEIITPAGQFALFKKWHHVHQLQNLYFALTGEELTTNIVTQ